MVPPVCISDQIAQQHHALILSESPKEWAGFGLASTAKMPTPFHTAGKEWAKTD
jgi:hypothetical protein